MPSSIKNALNVVGTTTCPTPLGLAFIATTQQGICKVSLNEPNTALNFNENHPFLQQCKTQLDEYFAHKRTIFTLPIDMSFGTPFMQQVWEQLLSIPYAQKSTYGTIAKRLQNDKAMRAVGMACGKNELWIVIPCHRVLGSSGKLTGYAGGLDVKDWLLKHELGGQTTLYAF